MFIIQAIHTYFRLKRASNPRKTLSWIEGLFLCDCGVSACLFAILECIFSCIKPTSC
ncbi:hypothetical protein CLOSTMETH_02426 [[Clostridium] methylpentosum DSM 5476]|uniref:Uncharacterized protein n=1 Tax=[Clostridium] methylpentosum DSM 5476 TaxID=537013 RepID=C0EEY7_9FIRM|nr:hypothetical protein CLOSTMETH_02426 [[Clostridium] methylpentosum DSM 5476]